MKNLYVRPPSFHIGLLKKRFTFLGRKVNLKEGVLRNSMKTIRKTLIAFCETLFLFGLLGWGYGVLLQLYHPEWIEGKLSHLTPFIRVDTFAILAFVISFFSFLTWRILRD